MSHPYTTQPEKAFWRKSISDRSFLDLAGLYERKFAIEPDARIASAGSCFAQHIGRHLAKSGFNYVDYEPAPGFLQPELRKLFGYELYSARYGNIYTTRQLLQLAEEALEGSSPEEFYWLRDERFFDPFRPTIEPDGFATLEEMRSAREVHLEAVKQLFTNTDVFIFTLGLTETWTSKKDGRVYPVCPGTVAGEFDEEKYRFHNLRTFEMVRDLRSFFKLVHSVNPSCKFVLTVSPVPLTATATDKHVLVATNYSKSALRAAAGQLADAHAFVDYFPSFEVISSHPGRGMFFDPNLRTVNNRGVGFVMEHFFAEHRPARKVAAKKVRKETRTEEEIMCDEEILDAS